MTKRERPGFRSHLRPDWVAPAFGLLFAASLGAAPASAETRSANLGVTATVQPSCLVSTQSGSATTSCSNFGDGSVAIERDRPRAESGSSSAPGRSATAAQRPNDVTYVTITY